MALAARHDGVVINADAMQVYHDLRILTARPTPADEACIPHSLYGHVDAAAPYSVAAWLAQAEHAIAAVRATGRLPIVVGGTGLYFAALTQGLSSVPTVPRTVRAYWRERQASTPPGVLHAELARRDPLTAALLRPSDPQRIVRALEVIDATGHSLAAYQAERQTPVVPPAAALAVVLAPDRTVLRARIAERFDEMMTAGAVDEALRLVARGLDAERPAMKAIGVSQLGELGAEVLVRDEAIARSVTASRQFAKRQETWFRNRFSHWPRAEGPDEAAALLARALEGA